MKFKKELIVQREPKSPVSEVFRTLRTNIQFMSTNKKLKTLAVSFANFACWIFICNRYFYYFSIFFLSYCYIIF